ncbi:MAG: TIGR02147 family protein [Fibrobacterales bacterium]
MSITIFSYLDYHAYFKDWYKSQKESGVKLSHQSLSDEAGFKSKSYIQRILSGSKAISRKSMCTFIDMLELDSKEAEYFMLLVHFKHAKSDGEKFRCLRKLQEQSNTLLQTIESKRFAFFSEWYHPVVREIVTSKNFKGDYQKLGRMIRPEISAKQAHESVNLLLELGLIKKIRGAYALLNTALIAESETEYIALRKYQSRVMQLGIEALERFIPGDRNVFTQSIGVSHANALRINELLNNVQKQIINIANIEQPIEISKQINVQYFPISKDLTSNRGNK